MPTKQKAEKRKEEIIKAKFGLSPVGSIRLFSKERTVTGTDKKKTEYNITDYWFNVSRKEENDEYTNISVKVLFKKDAETPENNNTILVKDGFFTVHGQDKYARIALFILDWDYLDE